MFLKKMLFFLISMLVYNFAFTQALGKKEDKITTINLPALKNLLDKAPHEYMPKARQNRQQISLPYPGKSVMDYWVQESPIQDPEYAARTPDIKTYAVQCIQNPLIYGRITYSPVGLYAFIFSPEGTFLIRPQHYTAASLHEVYFAGEESHDQPITNFCQKPKQEYPDERLAPIQDPNFDVSKVLAATNGATRRTYRLAIVTTGEFYQLNGANLTQATAVVISSVNAIQAIYDRDLAVRFTLLEPKIYTNASTDPFPANSNLQNIELAAAALDLNFGVGEYDIGHAFHNGSGANDPWGGGGLAQLGATCNNNSLSSGGYIKGLGWSGGFENNSYRWIQLASHEIGHMFFARHTFNGSGNFCSDTPIQPCSLGSSISCESAYEIGSGSTIMAYRDLCASSQNIQGLGSSDNYFHANSLERMLAFITAVTCQTETPTGNTPPVANAGSDYTVPSATPFTLSGSATDEDNDALTYCWEQFDEDGTSTNPTQGYVGSVAAGSELAPLFRSYPPSTSGDRTFPTMSNIIVGNNNGLTFEALPTVGRDMNFRLTVRDNNPSSGGTDFDDNVITVAGSAGPFVITSQNTETTWTADGTTQATITWNVANTTAAPVSCANVDLLFSADAGGNFNYTLATNIPNNGSYTLLVPSIPTYIGRIMVKCSDNIFFDVNNADITIATTCAAFAGTISPDVAVSYPAGDPLLNLDLSANYGSSINSVSAVLNSADPQMTIAFDGGNGSCANAGNLLYYETLEFYVDAAENYTFGVSGNSPLIDLYQLSFDPSSSCTNWIGTNGVFNDGSVNLLPNVTVDLSPGVKYILVITSFASSATVNVGLSSSGSGQFYDDLPAPPGFSYTYLVVEESTGLVAGFESESDLSEYNVGGYAVYGVSYDPSDNLATYVGQSLSNLEAAVLGSLLCANISANSVSVVVEGEECEGDLVVTDEAASGLYEANVNVSTLGQVSVLSGDAAVFQGGESITLTEEFFVEVGAEFDAVIAGGCQGVSAATPTLFAEQSTMDYELFRSDNTLVLNWHSYKQLAKIQLQNQYGYVVFEETAGEHLAGDVFRFDMNMLVDGEYKLLIDAGGVLLKKSFVWRN